MFISPNASRIRQAEAQKARDNRAEIVKALSLSEITRRDLFKWGLMVGAGTLALKNGLSPFARSAYAAVPTGAPRSPLFNVTKFSEPMGRLHLMTPKPMARVARVDAKGKTHHDAHFADPSERPARRLSYHTDFSQNKNDLAFRNPRTGRGPIEGRPPGEIFAHQRWDEYFPKQGYVMSWKSSASGGYLHHGFPLQEPNKMWCYGEGRDADGNMPPFLIKMRYGEPVLLRVYNNTPVSRADNGYFGRNETQLHLHNAHNGAESDGASNTHHFPGTFYDYRWSTTLARRDKINKFATDKRASGPDGNGGLVNVPGDFRELQGTLWAHDHRFFFTAENVYKGNLGMVTYYSGPDRGNEALEDGVNLRLPSGSLLDWGNLDFDVNLVFSDCCCDQEGQLFFDKFTVEGMLGDIPLVNFQYAPFFEILPRKYRFRILNACMSRMLKLALVTEQGLPVPFYFIANDGNFVLLPIQMQTMDVQAMAERFDIVVDFSGFRIGDRIRVVNQVRHVDGNRIDTELNLSNAIAGDPSDPLVGPMLEFRIVSTVESVDVPGVFHHAGDPDPSRVPGRLTYQIPIVTPVRTRYVVFGKKGTGDSRQGNGQCIPDCEETATFPWTISVNGQNGHSLNANRVSLVIPKPGEVEHWTYVNGGSGWDHPIHLHFEEGVTMNRGSGGIGPHERLVRKDVWRLRPSGSVTFQVQFGEFGGAYVNHCHNTVHEDMAMLARLQVLNGIAGTPQAMITSTPNPTPDGVYFTTPEVLPEGLPGSGFKSG